jgi:NADPH:quinone reductase-like Zn-dependent oxidoreductase
MAGVVEEVGKDVQGFAPGDEVYGMTGGVGNVQGSLAEYAAVDAALLAPKPVNLTFREAAAIPLSFITAWEGLMDRAHTGAGKTVLVQGGSGGVGHIAVQLAVAAGATVYATDRAHKASLIESYGARPIDFSRHTVEEYVKEYTDGEGFDIVFDSVGGSVLDDSFRAVKIYVGHVLSILGWGTHSLAPLSFRGATYSGVFTLLPLLSGNGRAHHGKILREATTMIEAGKLTPLMDPTHFTMDTVEEAYAALENRTGKGKIVLDIQA